MARIYVASSWKNLGQQHVVQTLREDGHQVYDFKNPHPDFKGFSWSQIGLDHKPKAADYVHAITTHPIAARGFMTDFRAMRWADTCVMVLPCGRSAHLELGWFAGQGKRSIILTRDGEEPELMALLADEICGNLDEVRRVLEY